MTDRASVARRVRIEVLVDEAHHRAAVREATLLGLRSTPKQLPVTWLYDERGSELFDEITRLPEYYPTRCEREILVDRAPAIASLTRAETLVELGSGSSEKTRLLLDALSNEGSLRRFASLDVSEEVLVASAQRVAEEYPEITVHAVVGDFERHLASIPGNGRRLVAFLGSTIGNLTPDPRRRFLRAVADCLGADDALLIGLDLVKEPARIEAAYNDAEGVSERFQRNGLAHVDRELGARFSAADLEYDAHWDAEHEWVDIGFRSRREQLVEVPGLEIEVELADGERLRMEVSTKFRRECFEHELVEAGLRLERWWTDERCEFAVSLSSSP